MGKATSLRKRLANYWATPLHPRTQAMVQSAESVEWMLASGEVDALMLEYNLIQTHKPRFNIRYRDDKSYPYLALTVGETWPRAQVLRGAKRKKVRYFGPYAHAWAIRDTLDALTRVFPVRTCSNAFFDQRARAKRPCLYFDIGRCAGPCVPEVSGVTRGVLPEPRRRHGRLPRRQPEGRCSGGWQTEMDEASGRQEYEQAAKLRDQLGAARRAMESQEMVLTQPEDLDVIGMAEDDLEAEFQVFVVRGGRVLGRKGWVVDRVEELSREELVASIVRQLYMERDDVPPRILVPGIAGRPAGPREHGCSQRRGARACGSACPNAAPSGSCMEVVTQNAVEAFHRHKLRRASDFGARSRALADLAEATRSGTGAPADRVLRHLQPRRHRQGRVHGGVRGRPAQAVGLSTVRDQGSGRTGRFRFHGGDAAPPVHAAAEGTGGRPRRGATILLPTRALVVVDGGRGQLAWPPRC